VNDFESIPWDQVEDLSAFRGRYWTDLFLERLPKLGEGHRDLAGELQSVARECIGRLKKLETKLTKEVFVDKDEIVRMVIVSAIAHQPLLLVGPPGTAKSKIIIKFCEGLGLQRARKAGDGANGAERSDTVFQYLLNGFTEPDEILGPVDITALQGKPSEYRRIREGSITDAVVIFLDEVFRGNSAILNAMLSIMNERRVYEAGRVYPVRARLFFGAANTVPTGRQLEDLRAFYERFILRLESEPVPTGKIESRGKLLTRGWDEEAAEIRAGYGSRGNALEPLACVNDILLLNCALAHLWGGRSLTSADAGALRFIEAYHRMIDVIMQDDLASIDDRKFIRLFLLMRAHALYTHNGPPRIEDLQLLRHTWTDPAGKAPLAEKVDKLIAQLPRGG
jgi:MoxR-like ATPase